MGSVCPEPSQPHTLSLLGLRSRAPAAHGPLPPLGAPGPGEGASGRDPRAAAARLPQGLPPLPVTPPGPGATATGASAQLPADPAPRTGVRSRGRKACSSSSSSSSRAALRDTDADSSGHRLPVPSPALAKALHASPSPSSEKDTKDLRKPGPALPSALGWPGEPPPAGSRGGACKRRPGTESRPRGAKRCSDRACAGDQAQDVRNTPGRGSSQEGPPAHGHRDSASVRMPVPRTLYLFS